MNKPINKYWINQPKKGRVRDIFDSSGKRVSITLHSKLMDVKHDLLVEIPKMFPMGSKRKEANEMREFIRSFTKDKYKNFNEKM